MAISTPDKGVDALFILLDIGCDSVTGELDRNPQKGLAAYSQVILITKQSARQPFRLPDTF
jgi:hypothetical protein